MSVQFLRGAAEAATAGWRKVTLGEIYDIGSSKRVLQKQWKDSGVPFYRAREIVKLARYGAVDNDLFISEAHFAELEKAKGVPKPGDLVVSAVGTLGACYAVRPSDRFYFKDASVLLFRPMVPIEPRFMQYAFLSDDLLAKVKSGEGATVGTFTIARAKATEFLLPPLEEQKRIVAVLDQAFAALDRAHALAAANLADADGLLANALDAIFRDLAATHPVLRLEDAVHVDCKLSYGIVQPGEELEVGLPIVRPVDLKQRVITLGGLKRIAPDRAKGYARTMLIGDELLLCVRGSTGQIALASPDLKGGNVTRGIVPVRFDGARVIREFAYFQFLSCHIREQIAAGTYGAALMQINIKDLRQLRFVVPDVSLQRETVARAESMYEGVQKLRAAYSRKLNALTALRQSLLQKAFAGELT